MFGVGLTLPKISAVLLNAIGGLLAVYKINDLTPDLVADFNGSLNDGTEFYDAGGTVDTFAELITHSRAGNATMTDGYGPELWTNPAQTLQGPWVSAGSGVYTIDGSQSGTVGVIDDDFVVIGKSYSITYTVSNRSAGGVTGQVGATSGNTNSSDGTYTDIVVATATNKPRVNANSSFIGTVSKISVREVPAIKWAPHNLVTYSEDFSNPAWTKFNISVSTSTGVAPDGNNTANKITETNTNGIHGFRSNAIPETINSFSVFAKEAERRYCVITLGGSNTVSQGGGITVDLRDGSVLSSVGTELLNYSVLDAGNGWYQLSITTEGTGIGTLNFPFVWIADNSGHVPGSTYGADTYQGDGVSGIYLWGVHAFRSDLGGMVDNPETGDSYVPTTSSAVYLPRRNHHVYNGSAWVNEGVLHESEARTNLVTYSDFDSSGWSQQAVTLTSNSSVSPDGTQSASLITELATNSYHRLANINTISPANTISVYLKKHSRRYIGVRYQGTTGYQNAEIDLDTQSFGYLGADIISTSVEDVGNDWNRYSITTGGTFGAVGFLTSDVAITSDTIPSFLGVIDQGVYLWGAQAEEGSTPSSLIPTNGATVSRALETLTIPAANMPWPEPNVIGPVSIQTQGRMTWADLNISVDQTMFQWGSPFGSDFIRAYMDTGGSLTGMVVFQSRANGVDDFSASGVDDYSPGLLVPYNIASRHGSTFINGAVDGVALTANTTPTALPDLSATDFNLGYDYMGTISMFRVWADDLADVGIAEATEPSEVPSLQLTFDNSETSFTIQDWEQ